MAALRAAAVSTAVLPWRQPHLRRALPGLHQQISTAQTPDSPMRFTPGISRTGGAGHLHARRSAVSTSAALNDAGVDLYADLSNGRKLKRVGEHYIVTFGNVSSSEKKKVFCEFIAQATFNFCSCSAVAAATMNAGGNALLSTGLVMAAHMVLLPLLIFTFGPVSGAHFNPMVTATFVATRAMALKLGVAYIFAQVLGGIVGAAAAFTSLPAALQTAAYAGLNAVPADHTVLQAFMGELYAAFIFISVLFGTVVDKRGWGRLGPIAVGLIAPLLMWIEGSVSSMCINPARAFGPAFVTGVWDNHWVFWTAPFLGGIPAGLIYSKLFTAEALSKENSRSGAPDKAPQLVLQEWLNGSPRSMGAGSHLVLNFDTNPSAAHREELLADPSSSVPDISYLSVWSGEQSRLEELIRTLKPKYSIALDLGSETAKRYGVVERETVVVDPSGHIVWRGAPSNVKQLLENLQGRVAASQQLHTKTA
ncbi:g3866 [Coccomyxa elongata]